jgi:2-hydroxy-6-oxonona-2,4-dienedioate hydrolase
MHTPFHYGWVDVDDLNTRYMQAGQEDRPALLFVHGTAGNLECFAANIAAHAEHFNCYALDLLGHGMSSKPPRNYEIADYIAHILGFMRAVRLDKASIVGVSMGSWIGARFAVSHRERLDKLTMMAAAGLVADRATMQAIKSSRASAADNPTWETVEAVLSSVIFDKRNVVADLVAARLAIYRQPEMKATMPRILALQDYDIRVRNLISEDEWRAISTPTLVIASSDDTDVFVKTACDVAKLIPTARLVEMKNVAHWPQWEDHKTFNRVNIDFLLGR